MSRLIEPTTSPGLLTAGDSTTEYSRLFEDSEGRENRTGACRHFWNCGERLTDFMANVLGHTKIMIVWIILVVVDGAIFFMLLVKWIKLSDKHQQDKWLNITVQILCGLFTYTALINLPIRMRRLFRLFDDGCAAVGRRAVRGESTSQEIFDYLSWGNRFIIIQMLVWNCITQLINQATRIIWYSAELSNSPPGVYMVNIFFALSALFAILAALWEAVATSRLRKKGMGPEVEREDEVKKFLASLWAKIRKTQTEGTLTLERRATLLRERESSLQERVRIGNREVIISGRRTPPLERVPALDDQDSAPFDPAERGSAFVFQGRSSQSLLRDVVPEEHEKSAGRITSSV